MMDDAIEIPETTNDQPAKEVKLEDLFDMDPAVASSEP
jgi:hypothetical protein